MRDRVSRRAARAAAISSACLDAVNARGDLGAASFTAHLFARVPS